LNDRIGPVRNIKSAVGTQLHVDRTKSHIFGSDQVGHFFGHVGRALLLDTEAHHAVRAEIARNHVALPFLRKMFAADNLQSAKLWIAAGTDAAESAARSGVSG